MQRDFDRVVILGAHESNAPWAFELKVKRAIQTVWQPKALYMLDHRKCDTEYLAAALQTIEPDLVLCFRCENVDWVRIAQADLYKQQPLWVQWFTETVVGGGPIAETNRANLRRSLPWMDHVFYHEPDIVQHLGDLAAQLWRLPSSEGWLPPPADLLPCVAVDPEVNKRLQSWVDPMQTYDPVVQEPPIKDINILWYGSITPRRDGILAYLRQAGLEVTFTKATGEHLNELINRSRLVLNIHHGESQNAETRIAEVMGAGTCLLTEPLHLETTKYLGIKSGVHYLELVPRHRVQTVGQVRRALKDWIWREGIAAAGYQAMQPHTLAKRMADMRTILTLSHKWDEESASWQRV